MARFCLINPLLRNTSTIEIPIEMYKVSILVPVYRVEAYIERCARSLFEQSYANIEYVFVDDCSPDNSIEVLKRIMAQYPERVDNVRIFRHEKNRGVAAARNTLLDNATGDFVSWVDSDDWLESNAIELLIQKQQQTNSDVVSGNIHMHYDDYVRDLVEKEYPDKDQMLLQQLKDVWTMDTFIWGRIYRRSLYEDHYIRCKEGANYAEDRYQVVRLSYFANSFATVETFVYNYEKRNETSITVQQKENMSVYLRNQYQHLQNWIGIRDFFSDKERTCYQLAVSNTSYLMRLNLDWALKYKTKKDFYDMVRLIDENEDCMDALGWKRTGLKGKLYHNYGYMWLKQLVNRSTRRIKRKLHLEKE